MRGLAPPDPALWGSRGEWFWRAHDINAGPQPLDLDSRAAALLAELEILFCAGAWASVVIVGWTLVEGSLRRQAIDDSPTPPDIDWLRERRNALAHIAFDAPDMPADSELEIMAQGTVRIVFKTLFAAAWSAARR
jgi:hypothetical protein